MLGRIIKAYITEKGMKFKVIGEKAGIKRQRFYEILDGKCKIEAVEYFRICKALSVEIGYFADRLENTEINNAS